MCLGTAAGRRGPAVLSRAPFLCTPPPPQPPGTLARLLGWNLTGGARKPLGRGGSAPCDLGWVGHSSLLLRGRWPPPHPPPRAWNCAKPRDPLCLQDVACGGRSLCVRGVSASVSVSEGAGCGLQGSLGLCEGTQDCFPLIFSSKPTVRGQGRPWGTEVPYTSFGMKIPSRMEEARLPPLQCAGRK